MPPAPDPRTPPELLPLPRVAGRYGIPEASLTPWGRHKAKVDHRLGARDVPRRARLILVSGVTPTAAGEGKTLHAIGLAMALERLGRRAICTLRQPSMGPVFGRKGGGSGGGRARVLPSEELDLHLTGDFHAVAAATNLLAAAADTSLYFDNPLRIDPERVHLRRVVDINDRALRHVRVGLGGPTDGVPRDAAFEITAASEVMAILGLADDLADARARLGRVVVADRIGGGVVSAEELGVAGAMAAILRDALDPTLMQTSEGTLACVHTGPFANIAHGNCSVLADRVAERYADFVVTEAGFAADMGAEKFFNIKCRASGMRPALAVLVASARASKANAPQVAGLRGAALEARLAERDPAAVAAGAPNLEAQLAVLERHGVPAIVAVNRFPGDGEEELACLVERALAAGALAAETTDFHARGGAGGEALAAAVLRHAVEPEAPHFRFLYPLEAPPREKIETLAREVYGAGTVEFDEAALADLERLAELGGAALPVCVAKTQFSLSHDPALKGRPEGFAFPVRSVRLCAGAGFLVAHAGAISTMPGMGREPGFRRVDVDAEGHITGLG